MVRRLGSLLLLAWVLGACSSDETAAPGAVSVEGTAAGVSLVAKDALALRTSAASTADRPSVLYVAIHDTDGACTDFKDDTLRPRSLSLELEIDRSGKAGIPAVGAASYAITVGPVGPGKDGIAQKVRAQLYQLDKSCQGEIPEKEGTATAGSIVVNEASGDRVRGTFDLLFPQGSLKGTFDVPVCGADVLAARTPTCATQ